MGILQSLRLRRRSPFEPPTPLDIFLSSPLQWALYRIYHFILLLRGHPFHPPKDVRPIRVVCLSDTHDRIVGNVPEGDLLVHAGDLTTPGTAADIQRQVDWLDSLPHRHKVLVAGNHDSWFDPSARKPEDRREGGGKGVDLKSLVYLQDRLVTLEFEGGRRLNVYGAGDIPRCGGRDFAFQYERDGAPWEGRIPIETDVLVTHGPPAYHMDLDLGCESLLQEVWRVRPKLHIFGHVHWGSGQESVYYDECQRAYETLMSRPKRGPLRDFLPGSNWKLALAIIYYGAKSIIWKWVMAGPGSNNAGLMVNAAQMYGNTGKLGNQVRVVDL